MEYIVNPLTGRKIKVNGKIYNDLVNQSGGNPILLALPPLSKLAIPGGLTLASYVANKYLKDQEGGGDVMNMLDNKILQAWLKEKHIKTVQPNTLIPIGVLLAIYNQSTGHQTDDRKTIMKQISEIVNKDDLHKFMKSKKLTKLDQYTELPFATIMGPSVFSQIINL